MSGVTVLRDGHLITGWRDPEVVADGAVAWRDGRILAAGPADRVLGEHPDARILEARGGLILPGLVNLHHHFYSALARGLDPGVPMRDFPEILDRLWWRLDRALDAETVRLSAELSAVDCLRAGCTTVFDHHASPSVIPGVLDRIAGAVEEAGLRAVLCYEVTDRNGHDQAAAGIAENLRFLRERHADPRVRGIIGLHASFTLSEETLREVADGRPAGTGVHVHVAEHPVDGRFSLDTFGATPIGRLERAGLLDGRSLLAHAIHVDDEDYDRAAAAGATLVHNPESNANNGVGRLDVERAAGRGCALGLGTDGMSSSILGSLRSAFLGLRGGARDPRLGFERLPDLLAVNARVAGEHFNEPLLGRLTEGAPADVIVVDAAPPTPLGAENWFGHLVFGAATATVRHTVAGGRLLLEDGQPTGLDAQALAERARRAAPDLWRRFHRLEWNTPYLGPPGAAREETAT